MILNYHKKNVFSYNLIYLITYNYQRLIKMYNDDLMKNISITGVKINYYLICHRKLWLFSHGITLEREHENVAIGKLLHTTRYGRAKKDERIRDEIAIDFIKKGEIIELHDIKKSRKMEDAHILQMKFYLKYLSNLGVKSVGVLNYPLLNQLESVELTEADIEKLDEISNDIKRIITGPVPAPNKSRICNKCAYEEFCFGDDLE